MVEESRSQVETADLVFPMHTHELLLQTAQRPPLHPLPAASSILSLPAFIFCIPKLAWSASFGLSDCLSQAGQGLSRPAGVSVAVGRQDRQDSSGKEEGGRGDLAVSY